MERQREGHGCVSRQHGQPSRRAERQTASVFLWRAESHPFPCLPALNKAHREVNNTGTQRADVNSDPGSPVFSCICFSHCFPSLSSPLIYSPQFVNRSLLMWFVVCITALLSSPPPSFFLPPTSLPLPACLPSLHLSPLWVFPSTPLVLPLQLQAIIEVAAEQMADRQMWKLSKWEFAIWKVLDVINSMPFVELVRLVYTNSSLDYTTDYLNWLR